MPGSRLRVSTAFLAISAGLVSYTGLEFMLEAVQEDFAMSADETIVLSQVSSGAGLLVVFLVGALTDRFGDRRLLSVSSWLFAIGAVLVGIATGPTTLLIGQSIGGVGSIAMSIVGLSVLGQTFPDSAHRARAFGAFAIVAPVVAIVMPFVSTAIIESFGWRWVASLWFMVAAGVVAMSRVCLPSRSETVRSTELLSPTLAGVALSGVALSFSFTRAHVDTGDHSHKAWISASIGVIALLGAIVAVQRMSSPSLDVRSIRQPGAVPLVVALFVVNGVNLFFFTYLMLQYRFHQSLTETAVLLILPQVTATIGALFGVRASARWGSDRVAGIAFFLAAIVSLGALLVDARSSEWFVVAVLSVAAIPIAGAVGPLTHTFMDMAPPDGSASASSVRNSAVNLGVAIGGLIVGTVVFESIDGDTSRTVEAYRQQAEGFRLAGTFCFIAYFLAGVLLLLHRRRRRRPPVSLTPVPAGLAQW